MDEVIKIHNERGKYQIDARELWEKLGVKRDFSTWLKDRIEKYGFSEGLDWRFPETGELDNTGFRARIDYELTIDMAKELAMVENNEAGKQIRRYFIWAENQNRAITQELSPQLQVLINLELKQKQLEDRTEKVERTLTLVKDTIIQQDPDWRKNINQMMNKIVKAVGDEKYQELRSYSYKLLEERAHCYLDKRLRNLKQRLEESGATKTKINSINKLDVIEEEPKLKEIYATIVKEMMIKYVA